MNFDTKKVLVTVKTYPNPSRKYQETVCVAGIDLDTNAWIRLYPIKFRDLEANKQFKKNNGIKIKAQKAKDDKRPESYQVDADSIEIVDWYDSKKLWEKRKKVVLPTLSKSFCEIIEESKLHDKSLGVFKPDKVHFIHKKVKTDDLEERQKYYAQQGFFDKAKKPIEPIPYDFRYSFFCQDEPDCPGHNLLIIDWEINQAYRQWRYNYKPEPLLLEKIKERWLNNMCTNKHDTYFFVGNTKRFRENFMVLGVFYPRIC
jgi:hypothetical protein